jgi:gluconate 2-dehydrogenase
MDIVYHQREPHPPEVEAGLGARSLSLNALLATADYVVLIIPHTPETEGLIGREQIARMKPTATLINVARGGVVDEDALAQALIDRKISMAGLDVFRYEPLPATSPLIGLPNVVMTPHTGGGSYRSRKVDREAGLANIIAFFDKGKPGGLAS